MCFFIIVAIKYSININNPQSDNAKEMCLRIFFALICISLLKHNIFSNIARVMERDFDLLADSDDDYNWLAVLANMFILNR